MKASVIYTRKRMGLDNNVWLSMLLLIVVCLGLLAYKIADNKKIKPCLPLTIIVNGSPASVTKFYTTTDYLFFKAGASIQTDNITWDFGDHTSTMSGYTASHNYKQPGTYAVTATVDGYCVTPANVTIVKPVQGAVDSAGNIVDNIIGRDAIHSGINEVYNTTLPADIYTWSIENNSYYQPRPGKKTAFKFKSAGIYVISLMLDNDQNKIYRKKIVVTDSISPVTYDNDIPKPTKLIPDYPVVLPKVEAPQNQQPQIQPPQSQPAQVQPENNTNTQPEAKRKIGITDKQLKVMLQQVVNNSMHAPDFERFFCSGVNTKVYVNNAKGTITFTELCEKQLQGKKVEIETAHIVPDPDNPDCESNLAVKYKKTGGFLKKIFK